MSGSKRSMNVPPEEKKGFMRFMLTLFYSFGALIKLNLLFLVTSLGIVTIPAALSGLARTTLLEIRGEEQYLTRDFFFAFRGQFKRVLGAGGLLILGLFFTFVSVLMYYSLGLAYGWGFFLPAGAAAALFVFFMMLGCFVFPLIAVTEKTWKEIYKTAFFLLKKHTVRAMVSVIITASLIAVCIILDPGSIIFVLFIEFSFLSFINSYLLRDAFAAYQPAEG